MKTLFTTILLILLPVMMLAVGAQAQQCSARALAGKYMATCDGFLTMGANQPLLPAKLLGTGSGDGQGNFSLTSTMSVGGVILAHYMWTSEPAKINPDCTGSATFNELINGQPWPPLTYALVVAHNGKQLEVLQTTPGSIFSCKLTKIAEK